MHLDSLLLGEEFKLSDTIHTSIKMFQIQIKIGIPLFSYNVCQGIYKVLAFVHNTKWLFYPWPKYLQPFFTTRAKRSFLPDSASFFMFNFFSSSELALLDLVVSCSLSTSLFSEVDFPTTKPKLCLCLYSWSFLSPLFILLVKSNLVWWSQNTSFAVLFPASRFC
jgi:hypothetical protein